MRKCMSSLLILLTLFLIGCVEPETAVDSAYFTDITVAVDNQSEEAVSATLYMVYYDHDGDLDWVAFDKDAGLSDESNEITVGAGKKETVSLSLFSYNSLHDDISFVLKLDDTYYTGFNGNEIQVYNAEKQGYDKKELSVKKNQLGTLTLSNKNSPSMYKGDLTIEKTDSSQNRWGMDFTAKVSAGTVTFSLDRLTLIQ